MYCCMYIYDDDFMNIHCTDVNGVLRESLTAYTYTIFAFCSYFLCVSISYDCFTGAFSAKARYLRIVYILLFFHWHFTDTVLFTSYWGKYTDELFLSSCK